MRKILNSAKILLPISPRRDDGSIVAVEVLRGVIGKLFKGQEGGKLIALLDDKDATTQSVSDAILAADASRVQALGKGTTFQDGYKKAKAEDRGAHEAELKEAFGIDEEDDAFKLEGKELFKHVAGLVETKATEIASKGAGKDASKMTAEEIKSLPGYLALEKEFKSKIKQTETDWAKKYEDLEIGHKSAETFSAFSSFALNQLDEMKPVLSKNPAIATSQRNTFVKLLKEEGITIRKNDDNTFSLLSEDGKVKTDQHGNTLDAKDFVQNLAKNHFDFEANNGGTNAGNGRPGAAGAAAQGAAPQKGYPQGYGRPKSLDDYAKVVNDKTIDVATRQQFANAYEQENASVG